jgi:hypothetical protein
LIFAHVTDFLSVGSFAIFNVADASISVGVAVLLLGVWLKERAEKKLAAIAALSEDNVRTKSEDEVQVPSEHEVKSG